MYFLTLFHGLKLGFEYLPDLGEKGTLVIEVFCLRLVMIFGVPKNDASDVQDGD